MLEKLKYPLVLASASPRRKDLLARLGAPFSTRPAEIDETQAPGEAPDDYVLRLAKEKAKAVWHEGEWTLGSDTTVVLNDSVLGKPEDAADASRILRALSGKTHAVLTGICFFNGSREESCVERTRVTFDSLSGEEIDTYIETGEPFGKAGAYAIQGHGARFVRRIDGCYYNVVGLPVNQVYRFIRANLR